MSISYTYKDPDSGIEFNLTDFSDWGGLPVWWLVDHALVEGAEHRGRLAYVSSEGRAVVEFQYAEHMPTEPKVVSSSRIRPRWSTLGDVIGEAPDWATEFRIKNGHAYFFGHTVEGGARIWKPYRIKGHIFDPRKYPEPVELPEEAGK